MLFKSRVFMCLQNFCTSYNWCLGKFKFFLMDWLKENKCFNISFQYLLICSKIKYKDWGFGLIQTSLSAKNILKGENNKFEVGNREKCIIFSINKSVFAISPKASKFHMFYKPALQGNLMGWIYSKLNEIKKKKTDAVFIGWRPSFFKRNHLDFEYLGPFHHQPCVKWPWIWNESTLHLLGLGWCHMQIWVLFSWLIMISFKPLTYLYPNSRIKW